MLKQSNHPSDALSEYVNTAVAETAVLVKAAPLNLYGCILENNHSADVYIQFFNKAAASEVTVGTTAAALTLRIPASGTVVIDPGFPRKYCSKGLVIAVTATRTGSGAPGASASVFLQYSAR